MTDVRCAAIIAGGQSSRMGRNKALLEIEGEPLILRVANVLRPIFPRVIVVTGDVETAHATQLPAIADAFPGRGPLAGLHAALSHFQAATLCVACDMPFLDADFIAWQKMQLGNFDAVAFRNEPLHAAYAPSCLPVFEAALALERPPSLRRVLETLRVRWISDDEARRFDPGLKMFDNWNTPEDVAL